MQSAVNPGKLYGAGSMRSTLKAGGSGHGWQEKGARRGHGGGTAVSWDSRGRVGSFVRRGPTTARASWP